MWLLRSRFIQQDKTFLQRLTLPVRRLKWSLNRTLRRLADRLLAKKRSRAFFDRHYPFLGSDAACPGRWIEDASHPAGRRWEGQRKWRSRIGPAVVCWECGSPTWKAWNVRMPDGTRQHVRPSMLQWRRRAEPPAVWTYGRLVLHPDDVEFVDHEEQPHYAPPEQNELPNLEAELARLPAFVADLQDDAFALTAFFLLAKREWMKVGYRDVETFSGESELAGMIAGLRGKGEIYLDVRSETLSGRERKFRRSVFSQDRIQRLHRHLATIGWRTHTADEIQAMLRQDLHRRLRSRMDLLSQIKELEARPAGSYPAWEEQLRFLPQPLTIYLEGDNPAWLGQLTEEQLQVCSGEFSLRLIALASSARIDRNEYDRLLSILLR
jgi:hypothetical protein